MRRGEVLEGTVDRIDYDGGIIDVRTRDRGTISVALPFNAKTSDVDGLATYAPRQRPSGRRVHQPR